EKGVDFLQAQNVRQFERPARIAKRGDDLGPLERDHVEELERGHVASDRAGLYPSLNLVREKIAQVLLRQLGGRAPEEPRHGDHAPDVAALCQLAAAEELEILEHLIAKPSHECLLSAPPMAPEARRVLRDHVERGRHGRSATTGGARSEKAAAKRLRPIGNSRANRGKVWSREATALSRSRTTRNGSTSFDG